MFRHRLQLRRWAARVLLLWLFGVGVGVANACAFAIGFDRNEHASGVVASHAGPSASAASGDAVHHGSHAETHDDGDLDHQGAPGQSNCKEFCDKASVSIPPQQSVLDDAHGHALPALTAMVMVRPALSPSPVALLLPDRDGGAAAPLPIEIVFLRLAL